MWMPSFFTGWTIKKNYFLFLLNILKSLLYKLLKQLCGARGSCLVRLSDIYFSNNINLFSSWSRSLFCSTCRLRFSCHAFSISLPSISSTINGKIKDHVQCCQLSAKLSGQYGGKIWLLRKKIRLPTEFDFLKAFGLMKFVFICLYVRGNSVIFLICTDIEKIRPLRPLYGLFQ